MKFSKPFLTALALLPLMTFASGNAHANNRYNDRDVCREYTKTIRVNGHTELAHGTACLRDDNTWEIVSLDAHNDNASYVIQDRIYNDLFNDGLRVVYYDSHNRNYRQVKRNAYKNAYRKGFHSAFYYPKNYGKSHRFGNSHRFGKSNYYKQSKKYKRNYKHNYKNNYKHNKHRY